MSELTNPYSCSTPGRLFMGYDHVRRRMLRGLRDGNSYAIIGGRRCGKTSFLLKLEEDLNKDTGEIQRLLPRLMDMQGIVPRSPADFFRAIYDLAVSSCDAPTAKIDNYQAFLNQMDN